tara:strand:+ start:273 stop:1937 length:1665 start_codon:yes stop_codon:yes gene_type:complete
MEFVSFVLIYFFLTFSVIGYGFLFSKYLTKYNKYSNIGYTGLYGIFTLTLISYLSNLFFKHDYLHNSLIIFIGFLFSIKYFFLTEEFFKKKDNKYFFFFLILSIFSILYFKSHDDFPYYHLSFISNLTASKLEFGIGIFDLALNHISSLFFFHSLLKLPFTQDYFYFLGPALILIFFNTIIFKEIFNTNSKIITFHNFLSVLIFAFINTFFYRLAEHGTDKSAIILIFLCILLIFQILIQKKLDKNKLENFLILITFIVSLKSFYGIYGLLFFLIYFKFYNFKKINIFYKDFKIINISILFGLLMLFYNIAYTGCLIYPLSITCAQSFNWGMDISTIEWAGNFYELWSKAGATPNYKVENPDEFIKGFNWFKIWIDNYFFNKVTDNLLGLLFLVLIFFAVFKPKKIKIKLPKQYITFIVILFLFFCEWFYNHPSLRYGGYHLVALFFIIPVALILFQQKYVYSKNIKKIKIILLITLIVFVGRNINRIVDEYEVYKYNPFKSPLYNINKSNDYTLFDRKSNILKKSNNCQNELKGRESCKIINSYRIFYLNKLE